MTETEFVMFLDADDWVEGDYTRGAIAALQQADVAFAPFVIERADGSRVRLFHYDPIPTPETVFEKWLALYSQPPCSIVWRTDFVRGIGGWVETRAMKNDDGELVMRAMLSRPRVASFDEGSGIYNAHQGPSVSKACNPAQMRADVDAMKRLIERASGTSFEGGIKGFGIYFYTQARAAFQIGELELGREILALARNVGLRSHPGTMLHRMAAGILGLEGKMRLANALRSFQ
jgi:hypothetical protein